MNQNEHEVIEFWKKAGHESWFKKSDAFDEEIHEKFGDLWQKAANGELDDWQKTAEGSLALLLLLDQFSRNMFRNDARAFSCDHKALNIAKNAVKLGFDEKIEKSLRAFFYLPFEHSEDIDDQEQSLKLFKKLGDDSFYRYAQIHEDIIKRFGRFPHRNGVLHRKTTTEEQKFLDSGGFAG